MSEGHALAGGQALASNEEIAWFWKEMDAGVQETLSAAQRIAIEQAVKKSSAQAQPADLSV